jgi:uncharacterized membrane protein
LAAVILVLQPTGLLAVFDQAAYAVCHRIPERSYAPGARQLPLCARCSGLYLGALAGILTLMLCGRSQAAQFPPRKTAVFLALFMLAWLVDGSNSYATLFPSLPHLYEPSNILRLATGTLAGLALSAYLIPLLNMITWVSPSKASSVDSWRDLSLLTLSGLAVVLLVSSGLPILLFPLAALSGFSILLLLGSLNFVLALSLLRRAGRVLSWRELLLPTAIGLILGLLELTTISLFRSWLTVRLGLPL